MADTRDPLTEDSRQFVERCREDPYHDSTRGIVRHLVAIIDEITSLLTPPADDAEVKAIREQTKGHTPGPWNYVGEDDGDFVVFAGEAFVANVGDSPMQTIMEDPRREMIAFDVTRANAALMAAAPTLLSRLDVQALTIRDQDRSIAELSERVMEDNAVCICGCQPDEHERYDDGEGCQHEDHQCIRVCEAAAQIAGEWRKKAEQYDAMQAKLSRLEAMEKRRSGPAIDKYDTNAVAEELERRKAVKGE